MTVGDVMRLDKWLWHARFFKTRARAAQMCAEGRIRVDCVTVCKAHYGVRVGDVLTFPQGTHIRVVRVLGLGARRGAATEARRLYEDLASTPPVPRVPVLGLHHPLPSRGR